jgi:hypothetical protein
VTVSVCQLLLPKRLDFEQSATLLRTVTKEAQECPKPSLHDMVERLRRDDHNRSLAETLTVCATLPLARLCFPTTGNKTALRPSKMNLLRIDGLRAPEPRTPSKD